MYRNSADMNWFLKRKISTVVGLMDIFCTFPCRSIFNMFPSRPFPSGMSRGTLNISGVPNWFTYIHTSTSSLLGIPFPPTPLQEQTDWWTGRPVNRSWTLSLNRNFPPSAPDSKFREDKNPWEAGFRRKQSWESKGYIPLMPSFFFSMRHSETRWWWFRIPKKRHDFLAGNRHSGGTPQTPMKQLPPRIFGLREGREKKTEAFFEKVGG